MTKIPRVRGGGGGNLISMRNSPDLTERKEKVKKRWEKIIAVN